VHGQVFVAVVLALLMFGNFGHERNASAQQGPIPQKVYFPQTGYQVSEPFLTYWRVNGGLPIFGYPMTEALTEEGRTVQYFERARFEHHPDLAAAGYEVQIEHLGRALLRERDAPDHAITPSISPSDNPSFRYFEATGFHIAHGFRDYWERYGGLNVFGYPLSTEFEEDGRIVQYFERVRFEWWPEYQGTRYEVLLERLGAEAARQRGVDKSRVERQHGVPDYSETLWNRELDIPALMYHQFGEPASRFRMPIWRFEQQLDWLQDNGYETVTLAQVYAYLAGTGGLPARPVVITLDDGHPSQMAAAESLDRRGMVGVFFITTGIGRMPDAQVRSLAERGHEIAAHSVTHADLTLVSDSHLRHELVHGKQELERISGQEVRSFAYPFGAYNSRVIQAVQNAGYEGAVAAWGGQRWTPEKRWVQPRIEIGGTLSINQFRAYVE
jgi:peptidoglycan/xylan/chitin deacetylase (PgdA/CDA1 family)